MNTTVESIYRELDLRYHHESIFHQVVSKMLLTAEMLELPRMLQLILAQPKNELMLHFPVVMDDGSPRLIKGYRVQHNNVLGPYKGGMRYHPTVSLDHTKALAVIMTLKCALARLPYGGAKGCVRVDPRELSPTELERLTRRFTSALGPNIGPGYDIPAPDVGTNAQIMAWMADTYVNLREPHQRLNSRAVVTGKPLEFGGSMLREQATGLGLTYVLEEMLPEMGLPYFEGLTFSLIGYGNVGSWTARSLASRGAVLRAVIDHSGAIRNDDGIDAVALALHVEQHGGVAGYPQAAAVSADEVYQCPVDVFIPAALEHMVNQDVAERLECKILAEAANAPTTQAAEKLLIERGIAILPAILCNCGGVTVSYFEWRQNRQAEMWNAEEVEQRLQTHMVMSARRVKLAAHRFGCDLRTASYVTALEYIGKVYKIRGIFP